MRDIATAQLTGNLTRDVQLRALPSGADVARLRVAFSTRRRHGEEWVEKTNYATVDVFGAQARACAQHLAKGARVFVDAELDWHQWSTQDGRQREALALKARQVLFEGGHAHNGTAANGTAAHPAPPPATPAARPAGARPAQTAASVPASSSAGSVSADDLPF